MATLYWVGGTASWDGTAGSKWATISGGGGGSGPPTAADDVRFDASSTGTCTITSSSVCRSFDTTGHTGTLSWGNSATAVLKVGDASGGALTIGSGTTITNLSAVTNAVQLVASSTNGGVGWPVTTNGKTLPPMTFGGASGVTGGKWVLQDALTVTASGSGLLRLNGGELDINGKAVSAWKFNCTGSVVRTLTLGSSAITLTGGSTVWDCTSGTNLTITANTATVTLNGTVSPGTAASFIGGSKNWNGLSLVVSVPGTVTTTVTSATLASLTCTAAAVTALTITGTCTFTTLNVSGGARTLTLPASTTTTVTNWNVFGTAGNLVTVVSSSSGTAATISKASGTVASDYLSLKDSTATGGALWFAGTHSTDVSGNTGWTFTDPAIAGSLATVTYTALAGAPAVTLPGSQASVSSTAAAGSFTVSIVGSQATVVYTANSGSVGDYVQGQQATVTTTAYAGAARAYHELLHYDLDANSSQALNIPIELSGTLETDVNVVAPPAHWTEAQVRARRLSLVMPTPSLDSRGRPT